MSCDEAVIKKLGEAVKADHSASLLALSTQRRMIRGMTMNLGEGNTKERIQNLAAFRRRKKGVLAVLLAGVVVLIVCLASAHKTSASDTDVSLEENEEGTNHEMKAEAEDVVMVWTDIAVEPEADDFAMARRGTILLFVRMSFIHAGNACGSPHKKGMEKFR